MAKKANKKLQVTSDKLQAKHKPTGRLSLVAGRSKDFLLEIGTEELPAAYISDAIAQLGSLAEDIFHKEHIDFKKIDVFGTPRRLVLFINALSAWQLNPPEEVRGPSKQSAFDSSGKPTSALDGFLKSRQGKLSQIKLVDTDKGSYVYLMKPALQVSTEQVLPKLIRELIGRIKFPKSMRWDESGLRFARPMRSVLAMYGSSPVRISIGRLSSINSVWVGAPKNPRKIQVKDAGSFFLLMKRNGILLDQKERSRFIEKLVDKEARKHGAVTAPEVFSYGLLEEVAQLVEEPVVISGKIDSSYLNLPREVLLASMAKYQRIFAIESSGKLLADFVAILDGRARKVDEVRRMYEHILQARLKDSQLFWAQDHKRLPLEKMANELKDITFHEKLGSMSDKVGRLQKMCDSIASCWRLDSDQSGQLERACRLAKADLVSSMVKEFPTLQGIVGKYYAADSKEPSEVSLAIEEQYLPANGRFPKTLLGGALSIIDKYDTLSSYFGMKIEPTGDQDPFGLRRAAQGIVEVTWDFQKPLFLKQLWQARICMEPFTSLKPEESESIGRRLNSYILDRLYTFEWAAKDSKNAAVPGRDVVDAVLSSKTDDLLDAMVRIQALSRMDGKKALLHSAKIVERTHNILKSASLKQEEVKEDLLQEQAEKELWETFKAQKDKIVGLIEKKAYAEATESYGEAFYKVLHDFFESVMVNVKEEGLQQNRLALMRTINALYTHRIADLSKLFCLQNQK